eukprot:jgi/Botrbrau1/14499/Bobra.0350s0005.2
MEHDFSSTSGASTTARESTATDVLCDDFTGLKLRSRSCRRNPRNDPHRLHSVVKHRSRLSAETGALEDLAGRVARLQLNPRHPVRRPTTYATRWKTFFIHSHRRYVRNRMPDIVRSSRMIANMAFRDFLKRDEFHESMLPALEEYQLEEPTTRAEPFFIMIREAWKLAAAIKSKT